MSNSLAIVPQLSLARKQELATFVAQFVTPQRQQLIARVLAQRTRYFTVLLENIFQPHNASAVLRSCDCFGVQDVHIIEDENRYQVNPEVAMGASQWLTLKRYARPEHPNLAEAIGRLKNQGYQIVATTLRKGAVPLRELPIDHKLVLCFGTEEEGLSDAAHALADQFVHIPMVGFTQSFNISVSAALCLHALTTRLRESDLPWQLSQDEALVLQIKWLAQSTRRGDVIVEQFLAGSQ